MKEYNIKINLEYSVTAEDEDEALSRLEERFCTENQTAENEFWDNCEVTEVKEKSREIEKIDDEITKRIENKTKSFAVAYDDGEETNPKDFEDDNNIHISRGKYRFVFSNGQDNKDRLTERDVKRFSKLVDGVLK